MSRVDAARKAVLKHIPKGIDEEVADHLAAIAATLVEDDTDPASALSDLEETALPFFEDAGVSAEDTRGFCEKVVQAAFAKAGAGAPASAASTEVGESAAGSPPRADRLVYCPNLMLMYGGSPAPLLKNATLELVRGHRYGVIGANGTGKTTMMARIAGKDIVGFPQELRVVHLRHEAILNGVSTSTTAREYARQRNSGSTSASDVEVSRALRAVGFDSDDMLGKAVSALSGGWQMRLALACAMAQKANLLLLDEPTNHLDASAVQWLVDFINRTCVGGETGGTALIVSHDSSFLNQICTDIIHFTPDGKLVYHSGDFEAFKANELGGDESKAQQLLEVAARTGDGESKDMDPSSLSIPDADRLVFPAPEKFPGSGKSDPLVLTLTNASFQHDGADAPVLSKVSVQVTSSSRIAIVGKNGSGKSTLLSILARRLATAGLPLGGELWMHSRLRLVFVSQHVESQLGDYMACTPYEYIQLRFKRGYDIEAPLLPPPALDRKQTMRMKQVARQHGKRGKEVETIVSRQTENQTNQCLYEVKWKDLSPAENTFEKLERLKGLCVEHLVDHFNQMMSYAWGEAPERPLTDREICRHLVDFGLPEDAAKSRRISMLSSGQKARLMMAASFWTIPHLVCLDEPTNYLDADAVQALSQALRKFKGGYIVVSHNQEFVDEISEELWEVADGQVTVRHKQVAGQDDAKPAALAKQKAAKRK